MEQKNSILELKEKEQAFSDEQASVEMKSFDVEQEKEHEKADVNYTADNIQVLEGLEAVRKRPGMYIGTTASTGLHHLVWEIIDNAIDESLAGYCTKVQVILNDDDSVTVKDNGRGIPIGKVSKTGKSAVETVYSTLHAGGKFGEGGGYKVAGGLHGVGASVVNALSEWCEVRVNKAGGIHYIRFENGGHAVCQLEKIGETNESGTEVTFKPDPSIFTETTTFSYEVIRDRCRQMAYLNKGTRIEVKDLRGKEEVSEEFCFEGGIVQYVEFLNQEKTPLFEELKKETISCPVFYCAGGEEVTLPDKKKARILVEVAFQYCKSYTTNLYSYCNNISTNEGGVHEVGFKAALAFVLNDYDKKSNPTKKEREESFNYDDVLEGLTAVVTVRHPNPQYEGQTKGKLGNSEVRPAVYKVVKEGFDRFLLENKKVAELILKKVELSQKGRLKARLAKESTRGGEKFSTLAGKLSTCSSRVPEDCELFIVEGNSAAGTAKDGRDAKIQAVLPLRGKILNTQKATDSRIFDNAEIGNMIQAIGGGYGENFKVDNIRYHKVIIMTDADVDGSHIRILLLTFFYNFMPDLIRRGHVYVALPPLYKVDYQKKKYYAYNDEQLEIIKNQLGLKGNYPFQRYKGLGEMDKDQLADTTMDPMHRKLLRVTIDDCELANQTFIDLMGNEVEPRKEFILQNAKFVKNLDI